MMVLATVKDDKYAITIEYRALLATSLKAAVFYVWTHSTQSKCNVCGKGLRGELAGEKNGIGLPNRNRTCDPQLRRLMLYPTELWAEYDGSGP